MKNSPQIKAMLSVLLSIASFVSVGQETSKTPKEGETETKAKIKQVSKSSIRKSSDCEDKAFCLTAMEVIEVKGDKITPMSVTSEGSYTLDEKMLNDYKYGNGNLNDVLAILPGVQYGEAAYSADQVSNIKPSEVSISGAEGYQTGYQIDGVGNNSKLSTGNAQIDQNLALDVSGHSQESFVNLNILDSITVYDSNIPAKYGQFSGGLVLAETKDAGDNTRFGLSYRETNSDFVKYHEIKGIDYSPSFDFKQAIFEKKDFSAYFSAPLTEKSGIVTQIQVLESAETLNQLGALKLQTQKNYNGLIKYNYSLTEDDELTLRYLYSPYEANYFDVNAINSDYQIEGGGQSIMANWEASREFGQMTTQMDYRISENSKTANNHWYVWLTTKGKFWGSYDGSSTSLEGGFGDIDKIQTTASFKQDFELNPWGNHEISLGYQFEHQTSVFDRSEDSIIYNSAIISPEVDCNGYAADCVETGFIKTREQLEEELGRQLVFPQDSALLEANVAMTGQYFQRRQISPKAKAEAKINYFSFYLDDYYSEADWDLNLGLRYEYNDFFKNHNFAPRLRASYDLTPDHQFIVGANRYFESDLIGYKLNQAMTPSMKQVRKASGNVLGRWQSALLLSGYRYEYKDTTTPYSDEFSMAYRYALLGGKLEFKWVNRNNKDSINRVRGYNELGQPVMYAANNGGSVYERFTLSWMANFDNQHVEFNVSKASNTTSKANFDGETTLEHNDKESTQSESTLNFNYNEEELVFLTKDIIDDGEIKTVNHLITVNDLALEKQDANRPIVVNLSWGAELGNWKVSAFARYNGKQETIYSTGTTRPLKDATEICSSCVTTKSEYEVYILGERPAVWFLSGSVKYVWNLDNQNRITFSFDGENLLNKRTYQASPFNTGMELGRRFWLGVSYDY